MLLNVMVKGQHDKQQNKQELHEKNFEIKLNFFNAERI